MKRSIFSAIALMVAATACTESGLIDAPQFYNSEIVFDTYIGKAPVTKAENINLTYLETSNVGGAHLYAFMCDKGDRNIGNLDFSSAYLDGRLICTTPTNYNTTPVTPGVWEYQIAVQTEDNQTEWVKEDAYWPGETKDLAFVAYNLAANSCIDDATLTQFEFSVKSDVKDQVDLLVTPLIYQSETGNETNVSLRFYHLLSRVGFKVLPTTASSNVSINIFSLKLTGAFSESGYVNLTSAVSPSIPKIIPSSETTYASEYSLFYTNESFTINSSDCTETVDNTTTIVAQPIFGSVEANRYMMLMPGTQSNAAIEVEYNLSGQGDAKSYARIPLTGENGADWTFEAGKAYEFILKISTDAIEFESEVLDGWEEHPTTGTTAPLVPKPV